MKIFKVGIVGAGNISKMHFKGMKRHPERVEITALCDVNSENLRKYGKAFGVQRLFTSLNDFIDSGLVNVAIVCTPSHVRKEILLPLIEAKIPVFCEKPFAESYTEACEIEKKVRQSRVPVAINQNFRRFFAFHLAREILKKGHLGEPLHLVQVTQGFRQDKGWRNERDRYVMAVMSIHWFDGYRYMLDDEPKTVYCQVVNSPAIEGGEDTALSVIIKFKKGTVVSLSESFSSFTGGNYATIDCEKGGLILGYSDLIEVNAKGERITHTNPFDKPESTYFLLEDLFRAIEEGRIPETSAIDNLESMRIMECAYRAFIENRVVTVNDV